MTQKLYVGGLSYNSTDETLKEVFSAAGTVVSAIIIIDKMTGRSRGFGFVEMSSEEEAEKAIEMFDGKEVDGRRVTVNKARPQENNGGFRPRSGSNRNYNNDDRKW
ncbi:RNA-binding protein [Candidatus Kuenenbacteria bacterium]|nr:RNA-binding protein [Candidatus Kuenenbacteria bacterium]